MDNHDATKAIEAAKVLRSQIADLAGDDPDFIRDTLEGEVDFEAIVRSLVMDIGEDDKHIAALKEYADEISERAKRIENRNQTRRTLILSAMEIADRAKLELDIGTVSRKPTPAKAIVTEEGDIPARFWKPQPPKLDLKALTDALKAAEQIPGATLSNGGQTVAIRR